jgi:hypothetical protein
MELVAQINALLQAKRAARTGDLVPAKHKNNRRRPNITWHDLAAKKSFGMLMLVALSWLIAPSSTGWTK